MLGIFQPRSVNNRRVCGNAEPLLPGLMKGQDEETQQSSPTGELRANEVADAGQSEIGAVQEDIFENLGRETVESIPMASPSSSHDGGQ